MNRYQFFFALWLGVLWAGVAVISAATHTPSPPVCFEDEVIMWTGTRHDRCVPLDNLWPNP